jgi:hypothetical protein
MDIDETRRLLEQDIQDFREKASYYETLHLYEAAKYADDLANNIELALTTMPSSNDIKIA